MTEYNKMYLWNLFFFFQKLGNLSRTKSLVYFHFAIISFFKNVFRCCFFFGFSHKYIIIIVIITLLLESFSRHC